MKVQDILTNIDTVNCLGNQEQTFLSITMDSRHVTKNALFIAWSGSHVDGHNYIPSALKQGASVIVCEKLPASPSPACTWVQVENSGQALGKIASLFYGQPSQALKLVGVTGTNGKTSIATLLFNLFTQLGYRCGLLSTNEIRIGTELIPATHTTPDAINLNKHLATMVESGCDYCFMEVSSHAIDQGRIAGLQFAGGIFTNITRDHLDYHKDFKSYLNCKKAFFDTLPKTAFALSNNDDKNAGVMLQNTAAKSYYYATKNTADFKIKILEATKEGLYLLYKNHEFHLRLLGAFNAQNILAVIATAELLGQPTEQVLAILSLMPPVRGRAEIITDNNGVSAVIDYAHTPDALDKILQAIDTIRMPQAKIITVVGAGGNRDKGKRPLMTQEALKHSHTVILTSDNPRNEEPAQIIKDMQDGLTKEQLMRVLVVENREEAIKIGYRLCQNNDILLIAGKGHECYQEIQGVKHHFDDREIIKTLMQIK